jgi:hypothetical protein
MMTKKEKIAYLISKGWRARPRRPHEPLYFTDPLGLEKAWGGMRIDMAFKLQERRDAHGVPRVARKEGES